MTNPVEARSRVDQFARIRVRRVGEHARSFADLDDAPAIQGRGRLADMRDDGEIMADQEKGQARLALEIAHEVQRLRLHRDVERRHRLVCDDEPRSRDERARDGDALALAAGKPMRLLRGAGRLEADGLERGLNALEALRPARSAESRQRLSDDFLDALTRVERTI